MEIVLTGDLWTMFARRFVQLQAPCKREGNREKQKIPFSVRNEKTLGRRRQRRDQKERTPKGTSPSGKSNKPFCTLHCAHTTDQKVDATGGDTCVFKASEEKHGNGTVATTSDETKEFNRVLNGGHTTTLSVRSILR